MPADWFGSELQVEVVATSGGALLGIGLLDGHKLTVDFQLRTVDIS
jgi:hypothetical protein